MAPAPFELFSNSHPLSFQMTLICLGKVLLVHLSTKHRSGIFSVFTSLIIITHLYYTLHPKGLRGISLQGEPFHLMPKCLQDWGEETSSHKRGS